MACETLKQEIYDTLRAVLSLIQTISLMFSTMTTNASVFLSSAVNLTSMSTNAQNAKTGSGEILCKCSP